MINSIKKKLQNIFKSIGYSIWFLVHGRIQGVIGSNKHKFIEVINSKLDNEHSYNIFKINNGRIYTDTVHDTAFIVKDRIIDGPSFQHRNQKNADIFSNIVFQKGTPKYKKNLNGTVFSLLTGGGGNTNYWHWLFDVLPRIKILENKVNLQDIDFFLFPDLREKFQIETLNALNIPIEKRISSRVFRHIQADTAIAVDHPNVFGGDPAKEIQNQPSWIVEYLRNKFLDNKSLKNFPKKFYIDRSDSKSNHSHLRKITNEQELKDFLEKKGFSIITLSDLSFIDQVNLFQNASQITGLHGAGFANLTFCKPKTLVIELKPTTAGPMYENLAKKINLNYQDISIEPSENLNNQQGFINIPLNLLEKKIS